MNFVVALKAEASPIIDCLKLARENANPFPLYTNGHHRLVLSGVGKELAAKATRYLGNQFPRTNHPWLNLGIAGHGCLEPGTIFVANRILDEEGERPFYPTPSIRHDLESTSLKTTCSPVSRYPEPIGYDMEASAFCSVASSFSVRELIQVIKVVSDNPDHPIDSFDRSSVHTLIENAIPAIIPLLDKMEEHARKITPSLKLTARIEACLSTHPFSETQSHQVRKLVTHAHSLRLSEKGTLNALTGAESAKQAIARLGESLEKHRRLS